MTHHKVHKLIRLNSLHNILATWFYMGLSPIMPGTIGSLGAYPIFWLLIQLFGDDGYIIPSYIHYIVIFLIFIGWWSITLFHEETGMIDHKSIVIDEVIGQLIIIGMCHNKLITYLPIKSADDEMLQYNLSFLICFIVFRFFDIKKPWIIGSIDRDYKGSLMVIMDDVVAALFGTVTLYVICVMYGILDKLF